MSQLADSSSDSSTRLNKASIGLWPFIKYFLKLGVIGFGGPVALVGYMNRDLVQGRRWIKQDVYQLGLALAQIMPGPLAAQLAIALGYFEHGILGATFFAVAFILPSFLMVVVLSVLYTAYGGLWWVQALFYGIGASVIAVIVIAAYKLARSTNKRDPFQWSIFGILMAVTIFAQAELAWLFILAGLLGIFIRARPKWLSMNSLILTAWRSAMPIVHDVPVTAGPASNSLLQIFLFFLKSSVFVFGSGLAIVPFLYKGVVQQFSWLNERQFIDAVAVAMITPGPVVITVAFIGYLVHGLSGATVAAMGVFLPVYLLTIIPAPWFKRHRDNAQLRAFVQGATAAATGALSGAVVVLAKRAIFDIPTATIALISLVFLWRFKLPEAVIVLLSGGIGLAISLIRKG
jgi:chromate transporter